MNSLQQEYKPGLSYEEACALVDKVWEVKDAVDGIKPEMHLYTTDRRFFLERGLADFVFKPFDVHGTTLTGAGGQPIHCDDYIEYLKGVLPRALPTDPEWTKYATLLREYHGAGAAETSAIPSRATSRPKASPRGVAVPRAGLPTSQTCFRRGSFAAASCAIRRSAAIVPSTQT
ncbi:MAG: hypothetical protein ACT4PV_10870 [Planctomycetaceae bacterium]